MPRDLLVLSTKHLISQQEIDVSKAYTSAFITIDKIPIFNEFDHFKLYRDETIEDYNMYIVKTHDVSLMFNKQYNLCYGKFLKQIKNVDILAYKKPSFIKEVNYKEIVEELYKCDISDIKDEDTYIKKLIANVNFGMLEKGQNTSVKSFIYDANSFILN